MKQLPSSGNDAGVVFSVADFFEAGREKLRLELLAGAGNLQRKVVEPMFNRPGLALTGFFEHFAWNRLQLIGNAENAYLESLPCETRFERFKALLDHRAFCVIFTSGHRPHQCELRAAEEAGAVVFASPLKTRTLTHHGAFILSRLGAPRTSIYGTMVEVCGIGVLIEGAPGLGKSETALGLVKRGHALVADDLTCIRKDVANDRLLASASESTAGFMEIRGIGIMHVRSVFGINAVRGEKRLQMVASFKLLKDVEGEIDRIGQAQRFKTILGVKIPEVIIPVSAGRDLVNLVEIAGQKQKLIITGHDPVKKLSERLRVRAEEAEKDLPKTCKGKGKRNG
jgi:HPr kinase/phosphorylase